MAKDNLLGEMQRFEQQLREEEKSMGTIQKYLRDVSEFVQWLNERQLTKELVTIWKDSLLARGLKPTTINGKLASIYSFLSFLGREDCKVKPLKIQRNVFRDQHREITKEDYEALLKVARENGDERLELLMETICATGIRVSEVKYITMEAITAGRAEIALKGKIRVILLPAKLCRKLSKYVKKRRIQSGEVFITRSGRGLSRKQIWAEMKKLCKKAGVESTKVFPHNLRHLFARCFYKVSHDLIQLADVLGHSRVETTRIYLKSTGKEHSRTLERLQLIS
ncbi:MAG: tyrosine-type recombinase/integrase [Firmicutes bacterium]|nr:tyrosine-type recombinase/integrase [Bacillota bacterium]